MILSCLSYRFERKNLYLVLMPGFLAILVFIAKMQSKHLDTGCKPSVQITEFSILKRLELSLWGLIIFLMIKGAVDNRLVFIRKVCLYHYSFVCWFYNLQQEHGKNIFSRLYNVFRRKCRLFLVDYVIFTLICKPFSLP